MLDCCVMNKKKRPTLQDVAGLVGVTKMTVSRFLRDPQQVSAITRDKIASAIEQLGYIPNRTPDILSNAKSRAIGVLVPSLTNQVFAEVIKGIEQITMAAGYQTMIAHYGYSPEVEEQHIASLLSYYVDGLLLSDSVHTPRTLKMIKTAGVPVVEMMDTVTPTIMQAVGFDNGAAAHAIVTQMLAHGRRQIVYMGARMDVRTRLKLQGYEQAMSEHGLEPLSVLSDAASSFSYGGDMLRRALEQYPQMDGIFCTNDDLAIGAIFECQRQRIPVPEQIAVAGFHGHDIGQAMVPKLASVITPREEMGRIAARELLDRLNGVPLTQPVIDLGFSLSLGQSI